MKIRLNIKKLLLWLLLMALPAVYYFVFYTVLELGNTISHLQMATNANKAYFLNSLLFDLKGITAPLATLSLSAAAILRPVICKKPKAARGFRLAIAFFACFAAVSVVINMIYIAVFNGGFAMFASYYIYNMSYIAGYGLCMAVCLLPRLNRNVRLSFIIICAMCLCMPTVLSMTALPLESNISTVGIIYVINILIQLYVRVCVIFFALAPVKENIQEELITEIS